jgi:serine/threonine protein kinase
MVSFNGWEKLEPAIGTGGQSSVYKARSPQRVQERQKLLSSLQPFSDAAKQQSYAEAIYSFSRPDLPEEIGALKIFSFRENSGPPVERLKREIEVLKQGRPNLPRLLDSNAGELWMITEYFHKRTLADYPGKFKGKPLEALIAFREIVKTVASLHHDGVVHRDIKLANIFVADDGSLVLGDFGLVYHPNDPNRLTLPNETVGPWQHLPWWANTGKRLEDPTPAVDVFLLGSLLWCMVSGDTRLYGERYRHETYDLEKRFPSDARMGLVNLVLSQCLGGEEHKCVQNAGDVLTVVDEVVAALTERVPIFNENNVLVLPCRVCSTGFLQPIVGSDNKSLPTEFTLHRSGAQRRDISVELWQCDLCQNIQLFGPGQPYERLSRGRKSRVDPQPERPGVLRW